MDKAAYCDDMAERLHGVAALLDGLTVSPPPSTEAASGQQAVRREMARRLAMLKAETLAKVDALRADTTPAWETAKADLDRRWQEMEKLRAELMRPGP